MDLLSEIWTAWNEQWGATVAAILGIIAIAMTAGDKIHRLASAIARWKGWAMARRWYRSGQRKYRIRRAKNVMFPYIKQWSVTIPVGTYHACLAENQFTLKRDKLTRITPEKPSWLNDYFVATALEALHGERKVAKAKLYELSYNWPPRAETYFFSSPEPGWNIEEQADHAEAESRCRAEQFTAWRDSSSCSEEPRFDVANFAETTAPGATTFHTRVTSKPNAPPCRRCWEGKGREQNISMLVDGITKHDLSDLTPTEITGNNQEFQQAVTAVLIDSDCPADASAVKEVVAHAITVRRNQLNAVSAANKEEWTEQLTAEFKSSLSSQISAKAE